MESIPDLDELLCVDEETDEKEVKSSKKSENELTKSRERQRCEDLRKWLGPVRRGGNRRRGRARLVLLRGRFMNPGTSHSEREKNMLDSSRSNVNRNGTREKIRQYDESRKQRVDDELNGLGSFLEVDSYETDEDASDAESKNVLATQSYMATQTCAPGNSGFNPWRAGWDAAKTADPLVFMDDMELDYDEDDYPELSAEVDEDAIRKAASEVVENLSSKLNNPSAKGIPVIGSQDKEKNISRSSGSVRDRPTDDVKRNSYGRKDRQGNHQIAHIERKSELSRSNVGRQAKPLRLLEKSSTSQNQSCQRSVSATINGCTNETKRSSSFSSASRFSGNHSRPSASETKPGCSKWESVSSNYAGISKKSTFNPHSGESDHSHHMQPSQHLPNEKSGGRRMSHKESNNLSPSTKRPEKTASYVQSASFATKASSETTRGSSNDGVARKPEFRHKGVAIIAQRKDVNRTKGFSNGNTVASRSEYDAVFPGARTAQRKPVPENKAKPVDWKHKSCQASPRNDAEKKLLTNITPRIDVDYAKVKENVETKKRLLPLPLAPSSEFNEKIQNVEKKLQTTYLSVTLISKPANFDAKRVVHSCLPVNNKSSMEELMLVVAEDSKDKDFNQNVYCRQALRTKPEEPVSASKQSVGSTGEIPSKRRRWTVTTDLTYDDCSGISVKPASPSRMQSTVLG